MKELATAAAWAIVYLSSGTGPEAPGTPVPAGARVPDDARGLLVPDVGVVQIEAGSEVRTATTAGRFVLDRGRVRVAARGEIIVEAGGWLVTVSGTSATIERTAADRVEVCGTGAGVEVVRDAASAGQQPGPGPGDVQGDTARPVVVAGGACVDLERDGAAGNRDADPSAESGLARLALDQRPPALDLPDVVADLSTQLEEVETEWADRLDDGPQREAQSCGCSEGGGAGGGLDPSGGGPSTPEPEHPDPGRIRIHIELPGR
jgi:hypothetical protein